MRDDLPNPTDRSASADRRSGPGLRFDANASLLSLGSESIAVPADPGNEDVLRAYVDLARRCRGDRVADLIELRRDDLDALALALDLEAADLAQQVERVLGASPAQAVRFADRLRESRLVGGVAKAAAGAVLAGSLLAGAGAVAASARTQPAPAATTTVTAPAPGTTASAGDPATTTTTDMTAAGGWQDDTEPVIDGPLTTTPEGVGLIPPMTAEADGTVLVPPAATDQQDPAVS